MDIGTDQISVDWEERRACVRGGGRRALALNLQPNKRRRTQGQAEGHSRSAVPGARLPWHAEAHFMRS